MTAYLPTIMQQIIDSEVAQLVDMLQRHDWYYAMSDDHRVYTRGYSSWESIQTQIKLVNDLSPGMGDEVYDCYKQ
jgi:hypothetical protein